LNFENEFKRVFILACLVKWSKVIFHPKDLPQIQPVVYTLG